MVVIVAATEETEEKVACEGCTTEHNLPTGLHPSYTRTHVHVLKCTTTLHEKCHFTPQGFFSKHTHKHTKAQRAGAGRQASHTLITQACAHILTHAHVPPWNQAQTSSTVSFPICFFLLLWDPGFFCMRM